MSYGRNWWDLISSSLVLCCSLRLLSSSASNQFRESLGINFSTEDIPMPGWVGQRGRWRRANFFGFSMKQLRKKIFLWPNNLFPSACGVTYLENYHKCQSCCQDSPEILWNVIFVFRPGGFSIIFVPAKQDSVNQGCNSEMLAPEGIINKQSKQ